MADEGANLKQLTTALALGAVLGGGGATIIAKKSDPSAKAPEASKKEKAKKLDCFGAESEAACNASDHAAKEFETPKMPKEWARKKQ